MTRPGEFTAAARAAILEVTNGRCARCGAPATDIHHRAPRRAGGTRDPRIGQPHNGIAACRACHEWAETHREQARRAGWLLTTPNPDAPYWTHQWGWRAWTRIDGCWLHTAADPPHGDPR